MRIFERRTLKGTVAIIGEKIAGDRIVTKRELCDKQIM